MLKALSRLAILVFLLCLYTVSGGILLLVLGYTPQQKALATRLVGFFCNLGIKTLGIDVTWHGQASSDQARFVVSNHLSYVDVLILAAKIPLAFVTSVEIRDSMPLGFWCRIGGCLFVERRNRGNIHNEVAEIRELLKRGIGVAVFPEATSTNGDIVRPFKNSMFAAAIDSLTNVQPIALVYREINNAPIDQITRDSVFWYGDMGFASHLWRLVNVKNIKVEVNVLDEVAVMAGQCRKELAEYSHQKISQCYQSRPPIQAAPLSFSEPQLA